MVSSNRNGPGKLVIDSIHGDIHLTNIEVRVVDTASFQRLRRIKQLAMAQLVYPNATHTRFAHSIGTLGIMIRVLQTAQENNISLSEEDQNNLRLAALLHDIGQYPYSHLMEKVDRVKLTEEQVGKAAVKSLRADQVKYPKHEEVGTLIITGQPDLVDAIGDDHRSKAVADLSARTETSGPQLSKLIHSSLDLDRLDYLLRDSYAAGVPYGQIDINYLLNNLKISPEGVVGFSEKAIPAVEHLLLARFYMHRVVYYHKTTYAFEEACRQLLRRLRDRGDERYALPVNGDEVKRIVTSLELHSFTDAYVDSIIQKATSDDDEVVRELARAIQNRKPPKLLKEVQVCEEREREYHAGKTFIQNCKNSLNRLAAQFEIPLGQFLLCEIGPLTVGELAERHTVQQVTKLGPEDIQDKVSEEVEKDIKVFLDGDAEPRSLMEIEHSLVAKYAHYFFQMFRLYVIYEGSDKERKISDLRAAVKNWDKS